MKIPSRGPWLASGVKMIGPKNPAEKPMPPATIAPYATLDANLSGTDSDFDQTYRPTTIAHSNETRLPIHHCPCKGINANGTQKIKKYVAGTTNNNTTTRNARFISSASNSSLTPILGLCNQKQKSTLAVVKARQASGELES